MNVIWRQLLRILKNKYWLVLISGLIWVGFFDQDGLYVQFQYWKQLRQLKQTKKYYQEGVRQMDSMLRQIASDSFYLERYAREQYLMKKKGETIYIVPD